ncbi:unnamed protein product [Sphagnum troendelagicum]|uniref:WASH complex subunit strumpellin homolog n=1 Tax=Sphagnum troendelagicum TaxID=128251 RepID=A0ABP0TAJ0_9BRYO
MEMADGVGGFLLELVSRGQALVAELLRLSYHHLPSVFRAPVSSNSSSSSSSSRYAALIFDFKYFKSPEVYEDQIDGSPEMVALDEEFREEYSVVVERFFLLFDGIVKYYKEFMRYLESLQEGLHVQDTVESVLEDEDGRQLLVEALVLHGVLLLLLEHRLPGSLREQLLVAHCRCRSSTELLNFEAICTLCRSMPTTQASSAISSVASFWQKTPPPILPSMLMISRPEELCARFPLPKSVIRVIIGRLCSDDLYNQLQHYPNPEHRWVALGSQVACLYVLLNFVPDLLHSDNALMKEIVDKFFRSWWVIPIYMGFTVDLSHSWDRCKAAKAALSPSLTVQSVREATHKHSSKVPQLLLELSRFLSEGVLTQEFVLNNIQRLLACVRECNVTLRWLLLHYHTASKKLQDLVIGTGVSDGASNDSLLSLMLDTATLEFELKQVYGRLLEGKEAQWQQCKINAAECMQELSDFFSGSRVLSRKVKDENLQNWFLQMGQQVRSLDCKAAPRAARKIQQMISALQEVEQFHQIENSLQTKQYLAETRDQLQHMVRTLNVQESVLVTISVVSDAAYAWGSITGFTDQIHARVHAEPFTVLKLSCLFLKLRSILDIPLLRISQCGSVDLFSVSEFYSSELVAYVRTVLEVIPANMFSILNDVIATQTQRLHDLPGRLEKEKFRDFAQLEDRYKLAKATHRVAVFTQGILAMKKTFIGAIELDPQQLLEIGVRKQLVKQIASSLHSILVFPGGGAVELEERLQEAARSLQAQRRSMEYFQDYVHVHGLSLWQEEFTRIIHYNTEQECNLFMKRKVQDSQSVYQDSATPIPSFPAPTKDPSMSINFMGRLVHKLLHLTDPSRSMYLAPMSGWFDAQGQELVGLRLLSMLHTTLGPATLVGIDRLLSCRLTSSTRQAITHLSSQSGTDLKEPLETLQSVLTPASAIPDPGPAVYTDYCAQVGSNNAQWTSWVEAVSRIGQIQLLRCSIAFHLRAALKFESSLVSSALDAMNLAVLADITNTSKTGDSASLSADEPDTQWEVKGRLLGELRKQLHMCGLFSPIHSLYMTANPSDRFALLLFLITVSQLPRYVLDTHLGTLTSRTKKTALDCSPLVVGVGTLLQQLHPSHRAAYVGYLGQYVRTHAENASTAKKTSDGLKLSSEVVNVLAWLLALAKYMDYPQNLLDSHLPPLILDSIIAT